jgi:hypothetical protein
VAAIDFLKREHISGNMFNSDEFGDYIIYSAYPRYKVFYDSRADIYGNEILQDYLNVTRIRPGLEKVFDKYNINWIIYNNDSPLIQYLSLKSSWILVYSDNVANIYVKNVPQNELIIQKTHGNKLLGGLKMSQEKMDIG